MASEAPVGVFDSGVGGISVLREIQARLPNESLLYVADSGFVPYGEKSPEFIRARSRAITEFLLDQGCKALVVACNTATAAAVAELRGTWPELPIVGMEPAVKPAASATRSGAVTSTIGPSSVAIGAARLKLTMPAHTEAATHAPSTKRVARSARALGGRSGAFSGSRSDSSKMCSATDRYVKKP